MPCTEHNSCDAILEGRAKLKIRMLQPGTEHTETSMSLEFSFQAN